MKILHTSDWHLGHRLHEQSQHEEQARFLEWLLEQLRQEQIDVLVVAGDVFDTGVPATQSQKLYYDFLVRMRDTGCTQAIILGGNHDAPGTLNAPKELLGALSVCVLGKCPEQTEEAVLDFRVKDELLRVAAVPYLRDQDIRKAVMGESFDEIGQRYKAALLRHYQQLAAYCSKQTTACFLMATGHLFAVGARTSESEQSIYVGNLGDISSADFPTVFDYIALGHLHRPQTVGGQEHIRYSGSPYVLSFSEAGSTKEVLVLETEKNKLKRISSLTVPAFRSVLRIKATWAEALQALQQVSAMEHELTPWVEVVLHGEDNLAVSFQEIKAATEALKLEVLKVSYAQDNKLAGLEKLVDDSVDLSELKPVDVFRQKCADMNFDLNENEELEVAFREIMALAQETSE